MLLVKNRALNFDYAVIFSRHFSRLTQRIQLLPHSIEIVQEKVFSSDAPECPDRELYISSS